VEQGVVEEEEVGRTNQVGCLKGHINSVSGPMHLLLTCTIEHQVRGIHLLMMVQLHEPLVSNLRHRI